MAISKAEWARIRHLNKKKIPRYPYWYGMKKTLYDYVGLPSWLPATVHLQHGANTIYRNDKPDHLVLNNRYPVIFLSNQKQKDICAKFIGKPIHVIGSVFPYFLKQHNITLSENAKGTLAFPTHSTKDISARMDWPGYARDLKNLPKEFQPVTVSLYYLDLLKGIHEHFEAVGIDVVTSGHMADENFVDNFYRHLRNFKYTTGNEVGSMVYYAVDMGIPFFIYGNDAEFDNKGNEYTPMGKYSLDASFGYQKLMEVKRLFTFERLDNIRITPEQETFVREALGKDDAISREKIRAIILWSLPVFILKMILLLPYLGPKHLFNMIRAKFRSSKSVSKDEALSGAASADAAKTHSKHV